MCQGIMPNTGKVGEFHFWNRVGTLCELCLCWRYGHSLWLIRMLYSMSSLVSSYFTFPPQLALTSASWKQAWLNWNFNIMCRMVTIHGWLLSLAIWPTLMGVLGPQKFLTVVISMLLQQAVYSPVAASTWCCDITANISAALRTMIWFLSGNPHLPMQAEFLFIRNSRI